MLKQYLIRWAIGLCVLLVLLGHVGRFWEIPFVKSVEGYFYDVRVRLAASGTVDPSVVIVDIDEKSLAEVGRWPWGRNRVSDLVRQLTDQYKVAVVGFDMVFAEPDWSSGLHSLEALSKGALRGDAAFLSALNTLRPQLDYDKKFAETLRGRPVVLGYVFSDREKSGELPAPTFMKGSFANRRTAFSAWNGYGSNLGIFQREATGGHFNPIIDRDGIVRRIPMLVDHDGNYYESLSLAVLRLAMGNAAIRPVFFDEKSKIESLELVSPQYRFKVPLDDMSALLVPYRGPQSSFPYVSAVDVLNGKVAHDVLAGRIVLVGTTASGLKDLRATPVQEIYPGVEIHANVISGVLNGTVLRQPEEAWALEILQILILGGLLIAMLPRLSPVRALAATGAALAFLLLSNFLLWHFGKLVVPLAASVILVMLLYAIDASWGYFVVSRSKRQFTDLFGQYVPPELVDEMARDPESYSMEGRNQALSVLFSDVRSFTTISEGLDPKELTQLMNAYLGEMTQVIRAHRGTLDKYIGDAIMAFWGAPVADPAHARQAVLAALAMQEALRKLDEPFKARGWPTLKIGVGINTGMMTVGDMGSPVRKAYTVMGDAVNLGSRLEGITKQYGVGIIVGEGTKAEAEGIVFRELDRVRVKGKDEPVAIYEPLGRAGEVDAAGLDALKLWQQVLRLYRNQDWDGAEVQLLYLLGKFPDTFLYQLYLERINHYRQHPPGDRWDGVTTFETK